jgi:hypothetical protein
MAGLGLIVVMRQGGLRALGRKRFTPKRDFPKPERKKRDNNIHRGPWG